MPTSQWATYLTEHSGLPGPRANLELLDVVGDLAPPDLLRAWAEDADEYLATCGTAGLGRLVDRVDDRDAERLRTAADDGRWRVREGVAFALQRIGDREPGLLREILAAWSDGGPLVQRAAAAGVCEPRLLHDPTTVSIALDVLDTATAALRALPETRRREPDARTLRQGLAYCWSVAVAADPAVGLPRFERWAQDPDPDVRWLVRQNLTKSRLTRADPAAVERLRALVG
ncbi:MAG: HEAT repeat domain-containing protein [Actinomycetales bacterium]|nr:HEAT repeat domain-containing protein [Actinomycetales bacterium]